MSVVQERGSAGASKGEQTRERILDIAEAAVLRKGFAATSLDEIIAEAGLTKSGFFYHFKDKSELARALLERYLKRDEELLEGIWRRADELSEDPLHAFLIGLLLLAETMDEMEEVHPGCMVAAVAYHEHNFHPEVRRIGREGLLAWRAFFRRRLDQIAEQHPPAHEVDLDGLADMATGVLEGGIVLAKALGDGAVLGRQVRLFRSFVRLTFAGR